MWVHWRVVEELWEAGQGLQDHLVEEALREQVLEGRRPAALWVADLGQEEDPQVGPEEHSWEERQEAVRFEVGQRAGLWEGGLEVVHRHLHLLHREDLWGDHRGDHEEEGRLEDRQEDHGVAHLQGDQRGDREEGALLEDHRGGHLGQQHLELQVGLLEEDHAGGHREVLRAVHRGVHRGEHQAGL